MSICLTCHTNFCCTKSEHDLLNKIISSTLKSKYAETDHSFCPDCRYQQRLANRNEWSLYKRNCDFSGAPIISIYAPNKRYVVYNQDVWWSDKFDGLKYGRKFDFSKGFFEQFNELRHSVPRLSITNTSSQNCTYTNQSSHNKDCYLIVASNGSERCYYGNWYQKSLECYDCYCVEQCELCYECSSSSNLYQCFYLKNSDNCRFSWFSFDCHGCSNLFGCTGLYNKSYYIYNEPVPKTEWKERISKLILTHQSIANIEDESRQVELSVIHKYYQGKSNEEFSGDYVQFCKETYNAFNARRCWNVYNSQDAWEAKDCCDLTETLNTELCANIEGCADCYGCVFINKCWNIKSSLYSELCFNSSLLFGCIGLKNNQCCIFNTQYSAKEYNHLKDKIENHMVETGEWGCYFPSDISCFGYNESVAQEYFPLNKSNAHKYGFLWHENESGNSQKFKVIDEERRFYSRFRLPTPIKSPDSRRMERYGKRNPRFLWNRRCSICTCEVSSSYAPVRPENVGCERCYLSIAI